MSKLPPIRKEQRGFSGEHAIDRLRSAQPHRRNRLPRAPSPPPGDADAALVSEARYGDVREDPASQPKG